MDRFDQINRILVACLTTELINQVYPPEAVQAGHPLDLPEKRARDRQIQIKVMEMAGWMVQQELGFILKNEDLAFFSRRVEAFLKSHGIEGQSLF